MHPKHMCRKLGIRQDIFIIPLFNRVRNLYHKLFVNHGQPHRAGLSQEPCFVDGNTSDRTSVVKCWTNSKSALLKLFLLHVARIQFLSEFCCGSSKFRLKPLISA